MIAGLARPERHDEATGLDPDEVAANLPGRGLEAEYEPEVGRIVETLAAESTPGDVVLTMSNGGFGGIHGRLLEALSARSP